MSTILGTGSRIKARMSGQHDQFTWITSYERWHSDGVAGSRDKATSIEQDREGNMFGANALDKTIEMNQRSAFE